MYLDCIVCCECVEGANVCVIYDETFLNDRYQAKGFPQVQLNSIG